MITVDFFVPLGDVWEKCTTAQLEVAPRYGEIVHFNDLKGDAPLVWERFETSYFQVHQVVTTFFPLNDRGVRIVRGISVYLRPNPKWVQEMDE